MASDRGVSEAEIIRDAIDAQQGHRRASYQNPAAWKRAMAIMRSQRRSAVNQHKGLKRWNREDLYKDRLDRYGRHSR
jgi:hypothetical protein